MSERTILDVCNSIERLAGAYEKTDYAKRLKADAAFGSPVIDGGAQLIKNYNRNKGSWGRQSGDMNFLSTIEKGLQSACKDAGVNVKLLGLVKSSNMPGQATPAKFPVSSAPQRI